MRVLRVFAVALACAGLAASACAQSDPAGFTNVYNIDFISRLSSVGSDTQINLLEGGMLYDRIQVGSFSPPGSNIELNLLGGSSLIRIDAYSGSVTNLVEGSVGGQAYFYEGSVLNVLGGRFSAQLWAQPGSEVNIHSGEVTGSLTAYDRSVVNVFGSGFGDQVNIQPGASVNLSGGALGNRARLDGRLDLSAGSLGSDAAVAGVVTISGGSVGDRLKMSPGAVVAVSGGRVGDRLNAAGGTLDWSGGGIGDYLVVGPDALLNLAGGEFYLGGLPVVGLNTAGDSLTLDLPANAVLTGVLADGTPFALSPSDGDLVTAGTLTLHYAETPPAPPGVVAAAPDLLGLRAAQVVVLGDGDALGDNFNAGRLSTIIQGAGSIIGANLELVDANMVMVGGTLGDDADAFDGAELTVSGGQVGNRMQVHSGGSVKITGGAVGSFLEARSGGRLQISGGELGAGMVVREGGSLTLSGGSVAGGFTVSEGAEVSVLGGEFRLNGATLPALGAPGGTATVELGDNDVLTGLLADGTLLALSPLDLDSIDAPIQLTTTALPTPIAFERVVDSAEPETNRLAAGQKLTLVAGGSLPENFQASGGQLRLEGGAVGGDLEAVNAQITITDGSLGNDADLFSGASLRAEGGQVGSDLQAFYGSSVEVVGGGLILQRFEAIGATVDVSGGRVRSGFSARAGAEVTLSGGAIDSATTSDGARVVVQGGDIDGAIVVANGGLLEQQGGGIGSRSRVESGGEAVLSGGSIGDALRVDEGGAATIVGGQFLLNGQPLPVPRPLAIDLADTDVLTGVLADGTPFLFSRMDRASIPRRSQALTAADAPTASFTGDLFAPGTLMLSRVEVPPAKPGLAPIGAEPPRGVRDGQLVVVDNGRSLPSNFSAGAGSAVAIVDGSIGGNLEMNGASLLMTGGSVGSYSDAFNGSTVTVAGGVVGPYFDSFGSTVVVSGDGRVDPGFNAFEGSEVVIKGGQVLGVSVHQSRLDATGGYTQGASIYAEGYATVDGDAELANALVYAGGQITITGGAVGWLQLRGGEALYTGGDLMNLTGDSGLLRVEGYQFFADGVDLTSQMTPGEPLRIEQRNFQLSAVLADGGDAAFYVGANFQPRAMLELVLTPLILGDFDRSGVVDADDLVVWQSQYGQQVDYPGAGADSNRDGVVDAADYTIWRDNRATPRRGLGAVPEPAAALLVALAFTAALPRPRR
ncbi:hypothetical protein Pla123a_00420 [Posidoniimonas polymericola]|uniref:Lipoprotein n=1 Tax=Posidoniimonas polymericola TaxID=2528002 RepID=A0A5C5ZDL5_9BACT|nr:hypothetical protein [Posidoniimonas polymericola]TWT85236.1 hypothetical protein Pla123a_00420 [Posidoniimonas polymericola]